LANAEKGFLFYGVGKSLMAEIRVGYFGFAVFISRSTKII